MARITIHVFKQTDDCPEGKLFDYEIEASEHMSVLSALQKVYAAKDQELAFHGYACYRLVCGLCSYCIDGKDQLACKTLVRDGMVIGPAKGKEIVKDLVVKI